jgi:glycosyltransferase involved in cell wall biosynthesis
MSIWVLTIALVLAVGYLLLMGFYGLGWKRLPIFLPDHSGAPDLFITVLIPARNEAAGIDATLSAIHQCVYPRHLLEILVLNNGSTDQTAQIVQNWMDQHPDSPVSLVELGNIGKKNAITEGVYRAKGSHIVCTDADCVPPKQWLRLIESAFIQHQPQLITAPVVLYSEQNLLEWFQSLDLLGLMGITGSGIHFKWQHMANGANMAYPKSTFYAVNGYEGNAHIPSGDDLFLVQKVAKQWPGSVFFLKHADAAVKTKAMPNWPAFIRQRVRWGSKNVALPEWPVRLSLLWVLLVCISTVVFAVGICFDRGFVIPFGLLFVAKWMADVVFLGAMSRFFNKKEAMRWFIPAQVLHTLYIALIGFVSLVWRNKEGKW